MPFVFTEFYFWRLLFPAAQRKQQNLHSGLLMRPVGVQVRGRPALSTGDIISAPIQTFRAQLLLAELNAAQIHIFSSSRRLDTTVFALRSQPASKRQSDGHTGEQHEPSPSKLSQLEKETLSRRKSGPLPCLPLFKGRQMAAMNAQHGNPLRQP